MKPGGCDDGEGVKGNMLYLLVLPFLVAHYYFDDRRQLCLLFVRTPPLSLSVSLSVSHPLFFPPTSVSASHYKNYLSHFPYSFPLFSARLHPSFCTFSPATRFYTHSLILITAHMDSVMAICTYLHERRSYLCHTKQLCNTCHASLTLSQFNTDNAIRQLGLDIIGVARGLVMVLLLRRG